MTYLAQIIRHFKRLLTRPKIARPLPHRPNTSRQLTKRRLPLLIALIVFALLVAQPLLISASPATRVRAQLAEIAQQDETETPEEEGEDTDATVTPTEEPTITADPNQVNIEIPTADASELDASDTITLEIPLEATESSQDSPSTAVTPIRSTAANPLVLTWQSTATTINAQALAEVVPPLQAEVLQGEFEIAYVAAPTADTTNATGDVLRILPLTAPGIVRLGLKLDTASSLIPFPAGQPLQLQLDARLYGPEATARLVIADDQGSSSMQLEGLNWTDYQVTRQIDATTTTVEVLLEWRNVPDNGWLELRNLGLGVNTDAPLSPTDEPGLIEDVEIAPTAPPATATPTSMPLATATALPTATPVPATATQPVTSTDVLTPTPTYIVVTSTPTPADIFEQATRVAQATEWAHILGPATPTPPNLATPTPTLTPFIIVLVNTPTPENAATATHAAVFATAVAFTTGTPTPYPAEATVATATATNPPPTRTPRPTSTPTPLFVLLDDIRVAEPTATPLVPSELYGKIVFLTDYRGDPRRPNGMIMNPDGTDVGLLTTNTFYTLNGNRDAYSADRRYYAFNQREDGGEAHNAGRYQIFYDDLFYNSYGHQLTYFGAGVAWSPAWSPTSETVAFVSSESRNDEIWVVTRGEWPPTQLTKNEWEWDHHPSFSPDGSEIVFSSNRVTGRQQIWIMSASGENPRQITNFVDFEAWNPVWVKYVEGQ